MDDLNNQFSKMLCRTQISQAQDIDSLASKMAGMAGLGPCTNNEYFDKFEIERTNTEQMNIIGNIMSGQGYYLYEVDNPTNTHLKNVLSYIAYLRNQNKHYTNFEKSFDYDSLCKDINNVLKYNHKKYGPNGHIYVNDVYYVLMATSHFLAFCLNSFII